MEGWWERGQGEVPDALFDPQFACNEEDYRFCKGFGKSGDSYQRSKHAADYRAVNRMAEGKGKGKDKAKGKDKGKEQPAVGGTGQPAVGGGGGKGKPAVGGKGQLVLARGLPFESNIACHICLPSVAASIPRPSCTSTTTFAGPLPPRGHTHGPRQRVRRLPFSAMQKRGGMGMVASRWQ